MIRSARAATRLPGTRRRPCAPRPRRRRQDAALGRPRRHADHRPALAEREPDQQHQPARLRIPAGPRQEAEPAARARGIVDQVNPTTWRFKLRPGVKFHDGTPFTADDVVFSFERARADTSQLRAYANASGIPKKIDDLTVEFTTNGPNPIELEHIATINIMSKAWCEKNRATKPQNYTQKEDMITARQANGTGPYMLKAREPDVKTVLAKNPNWWGLKDEAVRGQRRRGDLHADRLRRDPRRGAPLGRGRPRQRPAAAGRAAPRADAGHQGAGRHREPDRVHRHGPGARRAPVLERQGQEPVQGQARAPGALSRRRHRGDQEEHDARTVAAVGGDAAVAAHHDARDREAAAVRQGAREEAAGRGRATRTASR